MAKRTIIADDLDGSEPAKTYNYTVDGTTWEVDLSDANYDKFLKVLEPYLSVSRKVSGAGRRSAAPTAKNSPEFLASVREWAKKQKIQVAPRGRIKQEVIDQYLAANK